MPGTTGKILEHEHLQTIRFSEVDSMGIVWHGHYVQYLEEARESFGHRFGIDYLTIASQGYKIPIVDMECKYRRSLKYGDPVKIQIKFIDTLAAKIIFHYELIRVSDGLLAASAKTIQVFIDEKDELQLNFPSFFLDWKKSMGLN